MSSGSFFARLAREPMIQFLAIGAVVFGLYSFATAGSGPEPDDPVIRVTAGRLDQLTEIFTRTWQRPPTREELSGLVDAYVKEEVFYREGRKLGLDRDDTVVRRRLQQKMEFLLEPPAAELEADDATLGAWLDEHREAFRTAPRLAFSQVFLDPARHADAGARAEILLARLQRDDADSLSLGDRTLLPPEMPLVEIAWVERAFGREFAERLLEVETGGWTGPVRSSYGLHLVRVTEREPAREPGLAEIRDRVLREWQAERRREIAAERYRELLAGYQVIVEAGAVAQAGEARR